MDSKQRSSLISYEEKQVYNLTVLDILKIHVRLHIYKTSRNTVVAILAAAAMLLTVSGLTCLDEDTPLVYPYWSMCFNPARYYGVEVYELAARNASTGTLGSLAPEWDESNSTYYVRVADEGARYILMHTRTKEYRPYVAQSQDVVVVNMDTGRILSWREESDDEYFLVEEESGNATLQFVAAEDVLLPCPLILGARCEAYNMLVYGDSSLGLSPYVENGVTYFTQGSTTLPFLLTRNSTTSVLARKAVLASRA